MKRFRKFFLLAFIFLTLLPGVPLKADEKSASVIIPITCVGENTDESFKFNIEPNKDNTNHFKIKQESLTLKNSEKGSFEIEVSKVGNYFFTITEEKGSDKDTAYSSDKYTANVDVIFEDNELKAVVVVYKNDDKTKVSELVFTNVKKKEDKKDPTPSTPETPKEESKNETKTDVKNTSAKDDTPLWIGVTAVSLMGVFAIFVILKKERKDEKD